MTSHRFRLTTCIARTVHTGVAAPAGGGAERRKVVPPPHAPQPLRHRPLVERSGQMPRVAATERIGGNPTVDQVGVALAHADRRASKPGAASRASSTRIAGGRRALSARARAAGAMADAVVRLATWRRACTPASVRLAPVTLTRGAEHAPGRRQQRPWTVGRLGWTCQPWKSVPSYAIVSRSVRIPVLGAVEAPDRSANEQLGDLDRVVAAPLRSWSPTTQKFSAFGCERSSRMRPTKQSSCPSTVDRHRIALLAPGSSQTLSPGKRANTSRARAARDLLLGLGVDRDRVAGEHGHAHRGRRHRKVGQLEDLPRLVDQLHLLARVAVGAEVSMAGMRLKAIWCAKCFGDDRLAPRPGERLARAAPRCRCTPAPDTAW